MSVCTGQVWMLTWWCRLAEPREGSVCLTRTAAGGQIWALCQQTGLFPLGRFEEGHRVPGRKEKIKTTLLRIQIRTE